jgi:sugar lactone lactonase YvrE
MVSRTARIAAAAVVLLFTLQLSAQQQTFTVCPAIGSSDWPLGLAFDGTHIWVSCYQAGKVVEINASNGTLVRTVTVNGPNQLLYDGANIWVSSYGSGKLVKIKASTGGVLGTFTVGVGPSGMAYDGQYVWVANASNSVSKVLATTGSVTTYALSACNIPISMAFDTANVWVSCRNSGEVLKLSSTGSVLVTFGVPKAEGLAFRGSSNAAYLWAGSLESTGANLFQIYAQDPLIWSNFNAGANPTDVALDGTYVWVVNIGFQTVSKLLASTGAVVQTYSVVNAFGGWGGGAILFDGSSIWVASLPDGETGGVVKIAD